MSYSNGLSWDENITFDICFVSCDQSADPDPGFSANFDTGEPWVDDETYTGSYYPISGCFEDLTGSVDGEWELFFDDDVVIMEGTVFDWYLVFADDSGLGCANSGDCGSPPSCIAEGGELNQSPLMLCEGDPGLVIDIDPNFPNNNEPPEPEYDYTWLITDANTDVIIEITDDPDLTTFLPGDYEVCGLSFLSDDEPDIPSARWQFDNR